MRLVILLAILTSAASGQADILHLRDGSRYYGELISQTQTAITFRVALTDGVSSAIRRFPAQQVERVERTGRRDAAPRPPQPAALSADDADRPQMLREAFELLADLDFAAAVRALETAVRGASVETLSELNAQCRAARGMPLDELLATARVYVATRAGRGRGFKLTRPSVYERPALARILARQLNILLARRYDQRTLREWAGEHSGMAVLRPDARRMVADLTRAAALANARLRYDSELRKDRVRTLQLTRLQHDLSRLAAQIYSRPGYFELNPEDGWQDPADVLMTPLTATRQPTTRPHDEAKSDAAADAAETTRDNRP